MKYNPVTCPGFGDEITWPPYSGHPNDPRADDTVLEWEQMCDAAKREELAALGRDELVGMILQDAHRIVDLEVRVRYLERKLAAA